jgi:pyridoxine 5-phosphate synthase
MTLGVNIDHIAVLREARVINDPDILQALYVAIQSGADQITIHLREDRRHIQDKDVKDILSFSKIPINLECSINKEIIEIVSTLKPHRATLVPEKREEITTEGGLDLFGFENDIKSTIDTLHSNSIPVSLFVDPTIKAMKKSKELGAEMVELHTGHFSNIYAMLNSSLPYSNHSIKDLELSRDELSNMLKSSISKIEEAAKYAKSIGLKVAAGHGLNYNNVNIMMDIDEITELNIGQSIIARSVFTGLETAIKDMKKLTYR